MRRLVRSTLPVLAAVVVTAGVALGGPAIARTARGGVDADTLRGRPGVACSATLSSRAGAYIATCPTGPSKGLLPNNVIKKAPDADRLDGLDSSTFVRVPSGPQYYAISGLELIDSGDSGKGLPFSPGSPSGENFCQAYGHNDLFVDASAPVILPEGAEMTKFEVVYIDAPGSDSNGVAKVIRTPFGAGTYRELFTAVLPNTGVQGEKATAVGVVTGGTTPQDLTIDRAKYMYDFVFVAGLNAPVCGLRITFTE